MEVLQVTTDNFEQEVLQSDKTVLIDFWASWCGPCKMLAPIIDKVAQELENVKVCKINVDEETELARKYNIVSIPTLVVIKNGQVLRNSVGFKSKTEIIELVK